MDLTNTSCRSLGQFPGIALGDAAAQELFSIVVWLWLLLIGEAAGHMGTGCAVPPALRVEELSLTWFIYQYVWRLFLLQSLLGAKAGK